MGVATGLPILMYHSLDLRPSVITFSPEKFHWQMQVLHDRGYKCISLSELCHFMTTGQGLPERSVVLTFDDGYQSLYTGMFPILQKFGFSATVFLVAGFCGKDNDWPGQPSVIPRMKLLTWEQIREMVRFGIDFGSHTYSHPRLDQLSVETLYNEIILSKDILESHLGREVKVFAYPYGRYTNRVKDMVRNTYEAACSTQSGMVRPDSDLYELERIEIQYLSQPWIFKQLFHTAFPCYLSVRSVGRFVGSAIFPRAWR